MKKVSMFAATILSAIAPGAGLLLVQKGGWFAVYIVLYVIGFLFLFLFGLGIFIMVPVWIISVIHTIAAVSKHNSLVTVG